MLQNAGQAFEALDGTTVLARHGQISDQESTFAGHVAHKISATLRGPRFIVNLSYREVISLVHLRSTLLPQCFRSRRCLSGASRRPRARRRVEVLSRILASFEQ